MKTVPTKFAQHQNSMAATGHWIVSFNDGIRDWLISDVDMELTDGRVYALLSSISGLSDRVDLFARTFSNGDATIQFSNLPFSYIGYGSTGMTRLSSLIGSLDAKDIKLYMLAGVDVTALSDCLLWFDGVVSEPSVYDYNSLTVRARAKCWQYNKILPLKRMKDVYSSAPPDNLNDRIPLAYGSFTFNERTPYLGNGMAKGIPTALQTYPTFVFADHVVNALTEIWLNNLEAMPTEYDSVVTDPDDSGYATGYGDGEYVWVHLIPNGTDGAQYPVSPGYYAVPTNPSNAYDPNVSNYATIKDCVSDNGSQMTGGGFWSFPADQERLINNVIKANDDRSIDTTFEITYQVKRLDANTQVSLRLYQGTSSLRVTYDISSNADGAVHTYSGSFTNPAAGAKTEQWAIGFHVTNASIADSTANNQDMLRVYDIRIKIGWHLPGRTSSIAFLSEKGDYPTEKMGWAVMEGREFGSWIDGAGRSNSFAAGDVIDQPPFIVESILRDVFGVVTANIDEASFDDCEDSAAIVRVNVTEGVEAFELFQSLSLHGKFMFMWTSANMARAILLNIASPTAVRTIPFSHCKPGTFKTGFVPRLVDYIEYDGMYQGEYNLMRYSSTVGDADGVLPMTLELPYLAAASASGSTVPNSGGKVADIAAFILAKFGAVRGFIELTAVGFTNMDLEVGDWISLDSESWDPQILYSGTSWAGDEFMVTEVTPEAGGVRIRAETI